jgi:glutathione S-transferase
MHNLHVNRLYSFRRCPFAMRARMALYSAQIALETIEVSLKNKPQSLLDCSPKGTVPVLVTAAGEVLDESRDIMHWALHIADPDHWLLASAEAEMMALVDRCDLEFKAQLDRYKYFERYPEQRQIDYRQSAEGFLQALEQRLQKNHFLIDQQRRYADVAIFPFIRQFAGVDSTWFNSGVYPQLARWLAGNISSELFSAIMCKATIPEQSNYT